MKKIIWMEYAKVAATILIVLQHSISQEWIVAIDRNGWEILNLIFMLTRMGVPIFLMCSGMGMLAKERDIRSIFAKSIWGILKIYVFWMLVYGIFDAISLYVSDLATCRTVCNAFLKNILFGRYHTWFLATLIGLYLITPLLYKIVADNKMLIYFLALSMVFTILFPVVVNCDARLEEVFREVNMNFVTGYVLYFVAGYYIGRIRLTSKIKVWGIIIWISTVILGFLISSLYAGDWGQDCQKIYSEFSVIGFIMNISFLIVMKAWFEEANGKSTQIVMKIRNCGYGIYLIHPLLLSFFPEDRFQGMWSILKAVITYSCALILVAALNAVYKSIHLWTVKMGIRKGL